MNNKYISAGIVIVIIVIAGFLFFKGSGAPAPEATTTTPITTSGTAPQATTVTYTNDGFSPAELTVKPGTTVTFTNQSDSPLWVASAVHPTHLLYPEFDAKASVPKGGSYSFTFMKPGEHPYHNHVLLGKYGKVTVQ